MSTNRSAGMRYALAAILSLVIVAGGSACGPTAGSQTNWLRACEVDAQCGELECLCGTCTIPCSAEASCSGLPGASCVLAQDAGVTALCGGHAPESVGFCLPRCEDEACPAGTACIAGVCSSLPEPMVLVTVDTSSQYQMLVGFGASIAYMNEEIAQHPRKPELYEAMFAGAGLDVLRLRNRHGQPGEEDLASTVDIVGAAVESLGYRPTILLNSASPPGALKENGSNLCGGDADTCTLVRLPNGDFDYASFAAHWRGSLDAYASVGITPDYVGIQNNPNWVPPASDPKEACRFLPIEGSATVSVDGDEVEVTYPGFAEALAAVIGALEGLASPPSIVAPETTSVTGVADYVPHLDFSSVDAIAHHMYGTDPAAIDRDALVALGALGKQYERPILQTEMQANGFETAVLMHHALTVIGVSAYLQNDFVASASLAPNPTALIALTADGFTLQGPYHALRHYAFYTGPRWIRVATADDTENLLTSAWLAPEADALTVVLVNAGITELVVQLDLGAQGPVTANVVRTVFEGVERSTELGALPTEGIVRVPGRAIVTVAIRM